MQRLKKKKKEKEKHLKPRVISGLNNSVILNVKIFKFYF